MPAPTGSSGKGAAAAPAAAAASRPGKRTKAGKQANPFHGKRRKTSRAAKPAPARKTASWKSIPIPANVEATTHDMSCCMMSVEEFDGDLVETVLPSGGRMLTLGDEDRTIHSESGKSLAELEDDPVLKQYGTFVVDDAYNDNDTLPTIKSSGDADDAAAELGDDFYAMSGSDEDSDAGSEADSNAGDVATSKATADANDDGFESLDDADSDVAASDGAASDDEAPAAASSPAAAADPQELEAPAAAVAAAVAAPAPAVLPPAVLPPAVLPPVSAATVFANDTSGGVRALSTRKTVRAAAAAAVASADPWAKIDLPPSLRAWVKAQGFDRMMEVQERTIPPALRGRDVIGCAPTGSGKTLCFALPIAIDILKRDAASPCVDADGKALPTPKALQNHTVIIAPTRELVVQIVDVLKSMLPPHLSRRVVTLIGGMAPEKQRRQLENYPIVVAGVPGRMSEMNATIPEFTTFLQYSRFLALDEVDRVLEQGHFAEMEDLMTVIYKQRDADQPGEPRQTFVFSATLVSKEDFELRRNLTSKKGVRQKPQTQLKKLLKTLEFSDNNPLYFNMNHGKVMSDTISEFVIKCDSADKEAYLLYLLHKNKGRTLVFANSISMIRRLANVFGKAIGFSVGQLHADLEQKQRLKQVERFRNGARNLLFATDVAARGLDIEGIDYVIHYQLPRSAGTYVHRSGRTGRASKHGSSIALVGHDELVVYKQICHILDRPDGLEPLEVSQLAMKPFREMLRYAKKIEGAHHAFMSKKKDTDWMKRAAEAADIYVSDDDAGDSDVEERRQSIMERQDKKDWTHLKWMTKKYLNL